MPKVVTKIENPADIELTISATLTLRDWEKFIAGLNGDAEIHLASWPFFWLRETVSDQVHTAKQTFEAETENER